MGSPDLMQAFKILKCLEAKVWNHIWIRFLKITWHAKFDTSSEPLIQNKGFINVLKLHEESPIIESIWNQQKYKDFIRFVITDT